MEFNGNGLWHCYSQTGNETIQISVYQGLASLVMFRKGSENRKPAAKMILHTSACIKLADMLKALLDAQPGTRMPFVQMSFNKEARNYETHTSFVFTKDEHRCYTLEVTNKMLTTPVKFPLRCPSTFTSGSEPLTDEQKSVLEVRALIRLLSSIIDTAVMVSRLGMTNGRQRRGGAPTQGAAQPAATPNNYNRASSDPYKDVINDNDNVFG